MSEHAAHPVGPVREAEGVRNLHGHRPAYDDKPVRLEPGSAPRNGLPEPVPYTYGGTEHDLDTPWPRLPRGSKERPR